MTRQSVERRYEFRPGQRSYFQAILGLVLQEEFIMKVYTWNTSKNKAKKEAMTFEMWKMKKLDLKKLKAAFDNA